MSIYLAHRVELIDYATAIVGDRARGEDVVQEAFLRLDAAGAGRTLNEPVGYLRRIIRNLAIDWIRTRSVESRHVAHTADVESVAEDRPSQEDVLAHRDELRIVMDAMAELPERTRINVPPKYSGSVTAGVRLFEERMTLGARAYFFGKRYGGYKPMAASSNVPHYYYSNTISISLAAIK